jgi:hypothetical protein
LNTARQAPPHLPASRERVIGGDPVAAGGGEMGAVGGARGEVEGLEAGLVEWVVRLLGVTLSSGDVGGAVEILQAVCEWLGRAPETIGAPPMGCISLKWFLLSVQHLVASR